MNELIQQAVTPSPNGWTIADNIITDMLKHCVPASVVILIVFCILAPLAFRAWINRHKT